MEKRVKTEDGFASSFASCGEVEGNLENMSISELITGLRTAFVMEDFDLVEKALMKKETNLKSENEALLRQLELEKLEILRLESELKNYKEQCEEYKVRSEKGKKAQEMHEKLLEKVKQNGSLEKNTIAELRREICKLKEEKRRAELVLEGEKFRHESILEDEKSRHELVLATWKSKFGELDEKVSKLEKNAKLLMEKRNVHGASGGRDMDSQAVIQIDDSDDEAVANNGNQSSWSAQLKTHLAEVVDKNERVKRNQFSTIPVPELINSDTSSSSSDSADLDFTSLVSFKNGFLKRKRPEEASLG